MLLLNYSSMEPIPRDLSRLGNKYARALFNAAFTLT